MRQTRHQPLARCRHNPWLEKRRTLIPWPSEASWGTARLNSFSDGVFSIAATLLVLDIAVHPPGTPLEQVLRAWPAYPGYLVSFLTIGAAWLGHAAMTERLERTDAIFLCINLFVLLVVAFLPFPTLLMADALGSSTSERVALTLYGMTLLAIRSAGFELTSYAQGRHLYKPVPEGEEQRREGREFLPVVLGYLAATLIGLVWPPAAIGLYVGIAIFLVVPFGEVTRRLFPRQVHG